MSRNFYHSCISKSLNLGYVNPEMFCKTAPLSISFAALVARERLLPSVRRHVALQVTRRSASEVALVALVWLFSCMLTHHVNFQIAGCCAGELAHCASVRLLTRVGSFMSLQMAGLS